MRGIRKRTTLICLFSTFVFGTGLGVLAAHSTAELGRSERLPTAYAAERAGANARVVFADDVEGSGLDYITPEPECLSDPDPSQRCIIFSYQTAEAEDPLDSQDLSIAAVGQALEQGDRAVAEAIVESRALAEGEDHIQEAIEDLVEEGLPEDHATDPEIHPSSGSTTIISPIIENDSVVAADTNETSAADTVTALFDPTDGSSTVPAARMSPYKETTTAHLKWGCSCDGITAHVKVSESTFLDTTGYEIFQTRESDLIVGPTYSLSSSACRVMYDRDNLPDTNVHNWNRCYSKSGATWSFDQGSNWNFHGTKGAKYHSDWNGSVNPSGSAGPKSFSLRGTSWKYPSSGGTPTFP